MSERDRYVEAVPIFLHAVELPPEERLAWVSSACAGDDDLLREVVTLLENDRSRPVTLSGALSVDPPRVGQIVARYKIVSELGRGGMGVVWRAEDPLLGREVALKFLPGSRSQSPEARRQFLKEAQAASILSHPGIATIYDAGEENGEAYIAMELIEGMTVRECVRQSTLSPSDAVRIGARAAEALHHAHSRGVLHRDITARNVMLRNDQSVALVDFGLARRATEMSQKSGAHAGTPGYIAPELLRGKRATVQSDLFSLGVVLYELLTGYMPFHGEQLVEDTLNGRAEPPSRIVPGLPRELDKIVDRALDRDMRRRYASAEQLAHDLQAVSESGQLSAAASSPARPPRPVRVKWYASRRVILISAGLVIAAALGYVGLEGRRHPKTEDMPVIAFLGFDDISRTPDPMGARAVNELIGTGLNESSPIRLVSPEYIEEVRRRLAGGNTNTGDALQVARAAGAHLFLAGTIDGEDGRLRATWRLVDVGSGTTLGGTRLESVALAEIADRVIAGVLPIIARRFSLGAPSPGTGVASLTTGSSEAYRHYVTALDPGLTSRQAIVEFAKAIELDSTFALAHFQLSQFLMEDAVLDVPGSTEHADAAWRHRSRLGLKDRMLLEAWRELHESNARCLDVYREIVARWPDDLEALRALGGRLIYYWYWKEAVPLCERALTLYPNDTDLRLVYGFALTLVDSPDALDVYLSLVRDEPEQPERWANLGGVYMRLGMPDSAIACFRRVQKYDSDNFVVPLKLVEMEYRRGNRGRALATLDSLASKSTSSPAFENALVNDTSMKGTAWLLAEAGAFNEGLARVAEFLSVPRDARHVRDSRFTQLFLLMEMGRARDALEMLRDAPDDYVIQPKLGVAWMRARALADLDSLAAARATLEDVAYLSEEWGGSSQTRLLWTGAYIDFRANDFAGCIEKIGIVRVNHWMLHGSLYERDMMLLEARSHLALRHYAEAEESLRELCRHHGDWAIGHYYLAQVYEATNRESDAAREYGIFLEKWKGADPGRIELAFAKERLDQITR
jgi:serine/threonine protein kinase/tetratricopeptide (TPR) repeat protein